MIAQQKDLKLSKQATQIAQLKQVQSDLRAANMQLNLKITALKGENEILNEKVVRNKDVEQNLKIQLGESDSRYEKAMNELSEAHRDIQKKSQDLDNRSRELEEILNNQRELKEELDRWKQKLMDADRERENQNSQIFDLKKENEDLQLKLQNEVNILKRKLIEHTSELQSELVSRNAVTKEKDCQLEGLLSDCERLRTVIVEHQLTIESL